MWTPTPEVVHKLFWTSSKRAKNEDKQRCHSGTRHSAPTCSIILPSVIQIFQTVLELCSGNQLLMRAQPPARPPDDVHHFNNQFSVENPG